jgi:hypothetical protein
MNIEALILISLALIILILIQQKTYLPASASDWFVIFSIYAKEKRVVLWFYPIVALRLEIDGVTVITSRPLITAKLAAGNPELGSVSYGRWVRDNALMDEFGYPELVGDYLTFSATIESYLYQEFEINFGNTVPKYYQQAVIDEAKKVRQL